MWRWVPPNGAEAGQRSQRGYVHGKRKAVAGRLLMCPGEMVSLGNPGSGSMSRTCTPCRASSMAVAAGYTGATTITS